MDRSDTMLEIRTLGCFGIFVDGKPVAINWPDETVQMLFCSLLSPLDIYFTWDRICRTILGAPESRASRHRLEVEFIRPLTRFLIREFGFNPLIAGPENMRIDRQVIQVDAHEFYNAVLEGLNLISLSDHAAALAKFKRADILYAGIYLPEMPGKIIENTRHDLESLYRTVVIEGIRPAEVQRTAKTSRHLPTLAQRAL
jgi:hypothetical protein